MKKLSILFQNSTKYNIKFILIIEKIFLLFLVLLQTKVLFQRSDLYWYLMKSLSNIVQWVVKPCYYATEQMYEFVREA